MQMTTATVSTNKNPTVNNSNSWSERFQFYILTKSRCALAIMVHAVLTLVLFAHFFVYEWHKLHTNPDFEEEPHYWQKNIILCIEFGLTHCMLLAMVVMPLSMSRKGLAWVSGTWINKYLPLDSIVFMHSYYGVIMAIQVFLAAFGFIYNDASLCIWYKEGSEPTNEGCTAFYSEITITGYVILAIMTAMFFTSISPIRRKISYEAFFYTHHLFILLYIVCILHSLDAVVRVVHVYYYCVLLICSQSTYV